MFLRRGLIKQNKKIVKKKINKSKVTILHRWNNQTFSSVRILTMLFVTRNGHEGFWGGVGIFQLLQEIVIYSMGVFTPWVLFFLMVEEQGDNAQKSKKTILFYGALAIAINIAYLYFNLFLQYPLQDISITEPPVIENLPTISKNGELPTSAPAQEKVPLGYDVEIEEWCAVVLILIMEILRQKGYWS